MASSSSIERIFGRPCALTNWSTPRYRCKYDWVRTDHYFNFLQAGDFRRRVPRFTVGRRALNVDQRGEVATVAKRGRDRGLVRRESIGRDLEFAMRSVPQALMNTLIVA